MNLRAEGLGRVGPVKARRAPPENVFRRLDARRARGSLRPMPREGHEQVQRRFEVKVR